MNAGNPREDGTGVQMAFSNTNDPKYQLCYSCSYAVLEEIWIRWIWEHRATALSDTRLNLCNKVKMVSNNFYSKISVLQHSTTSHIIETLQCRSDKHQRSGAAWHLSDLSTCGRWPDPWHSGFTLDSIFTVFVLEFPLSPPELSSAFSAF